jgi:hypothetical protein
VAIFPALETILNLFLFWNFCRAGLTCRSPSCTGAHMSEPRLHLVPGYASSSMRHLSPAVHVPVYNSGRQILSEERRSKSCPKPFIAVTLHGELPSALHMLRLPVASSTSFPCAGPPSPHQRIACAESCSKLTSPSFPFGHECLHADHLHRSPSGAASASMGFSRSLCAS